MSVDSFILIMSSVVVTHWHQMPNQVTRLLIPSPR